MLYSNVRSVGLNLVQGRTRTAHCIVYSHSRKSCSFRKKYYTVLSCAKLATGLGILVMNSEMEEPSTIIAGEGSGSVGSHPLDPFGTHRVKGQGLVVKRGCCVHSG